MSIVTESSPLILEQAQTILQNIHIPEYLDGNLRADAEGVYPGEPESSDAYIARLYRQAVDTRVTTRDAIMTPRTLEEHVPLTAASLLTTINARQRIGNILTGTDNRLIVVTGPCSIHDPEAGLEYADFIRQQRERYGDDLEIVMRTYFEKPRTTVGWKGLINDPELDGSHNINLGLVAARLFLAEVTAMGVPTAMERLDTSTPQYFNGLIAVDGIGARNVTDQNLRALASGSSSPVGIKNAPEGSIKAAAEAVLAANSPHSFLGVDLDGKLIQMQSAGNPWAHVVLRGSDKGPNYDSKHVLSAISILDKLGLLQAVGIDASHDNSGKDYRNQMIAVRDVASQVSRGQQAIKEVMIESNVNPGKQAHAGKKRHELKHGVSITDGCVGIPETVEMLELLAGSARQRRRTALEAAN